MPKLTFSVTEAGLAVPVWIGLRAPRMLALQEAGRAIPAPLLIQGVVDTGSNVTAVARTVLKQLGIRTSLRASTHTAAGRVRVRLARVSLAITDPGKAQSPWLREPDLQIMELAAPLPDADVIIGRDVLLKIKLHLNGPAGRQGGSHLISIDGSDPGTGGYCRPVSRSMTQQPRTCGPGPRQ
jgi:hypothetical protein